MIKPKKLRSPIAAMLAVIMLLGLFAGAVPTQVSAAGKKSSAQIKEEINALKDKQSEMKEEIKELQGQVSGNMSQMKDIVAKKSAIDQEVFLLHEQISNINDQVDAYSDLIAEKQVELDEAQLRLEELKLKNKARIRAMEEEGRISYWSVLFKARSFSDLLDRLSMIQEIAASDQRRLKEMNRAAEEVAVAKEGLEAEKVALEATKDELAATRESLEDKREEADALLQDLVAQGMEYQDLLDAAEAENAEMMKEINKLNSEYDAAKEREYQEWLAAQPKPPVSSGGVVDGIKWLTPINYTRFSSPFGWREHPVYGGQRFHYGVDLSAPQGTPIYASRGGRVTTATYGASGGYYVVIDHLDGYTTNYLHMTHFIVSPGQYVAQGQVIGYCGSTGASTGPHLHFAIYKNGTAVNPALYINI